MNTQQNTEEEHVRLDANRQKTLAALHIARALARKAMNDLTTAQVVLDKAKKGLAFHKIHADSVGAEIERKIEELKK